MNRSIRHVAIALLACVPLSAVQAHEREAAGIDGGIRQALSEARAEVRVDLARARLELETGNLQLGEDFRFGRQGRADTRLPRAEITPRGDFLVGGEVQAIDAGQRARLLAYRSQVIEVARAGIEAGQRSADAALDAVGNGSWVGLAFAAMTGSLERRIERVVRQEIEPAVLAICRQLPALRDSQQGLASSLPQFRPYATLEADDVANCESQLRNELASR